MEEELEVLLEEEEEIQIELEQEEELEIGLEGDATNVTVNNYEELPNKPRINDIELIGNKTAKELELQEEMETLSNLEIEEILKL